MASAKTGISGVGLAVVIAGAILVWSGVQNKELIPMLRELAEGKKPTPGPQTQTSVPGSGMGGIGYAVPDGGTGGNQRIVAIAASFKGRSYVFGGGHGKVCPSGGMDCSGYASCVLNKAGVMKGTLTTTGFAKWGVGVPFNRRQPGDLVVWVGGPAGGHMGIVRDNNTMWHNPCTGCGGVQIGRYGATRTGRQTIVRRAKGGSGGTVRV